MELRETLDKIKYKVLIFCILALSVWLLPNDIAELVSLFLTVPTIILGLGVIRKWGYKALVVLAKPAKDRSAVDWLVLGVACGFSGAVPDNAWWGIAWSLFFLESSYTDWWFDNGVYSNIVFRQMAGVYSAYCHLQSSIHREDNQSITEFRIYGRLSLFMAIFYILWLVSMNAAK